MEQKTAGAPVTARTQPPATGRRSPPWPAVVCAAFCLVQLALVVPGSGLGWDETVYTSQVSGFVPAAFFSAPRARGITLLAAPVAELTTSTLALRVWMAVLSATALYLALRVWRTLVPAPVLALAGGLFATLWITVFYGPQVMPNLWSAYGALAAAGCFLRAARDPADRPARLGLGVAVALTGLMRPLDAVWLVIPLALVALFVRGARRPLLFGALAAGLLLGCGEWVVEAYLRYGGLTQRLDRASAIQGGTGWNIAVDDQIRALNGHTLCRPCDVPWRGRITSVWWFALPFLAAGGVAASNRARRRSTALLPLLVASAMALPYLFRLGYAAPRFLLPAYALLSLPVAACLWALLAAPAGRLRPALTGLIVLALCGHLAVQFATARADVRSNRAMRHAYDAVAARLHAAGVRPPCVLTGDHAVPMAFYTGCSSRQIGGSDGSITPAGLLAAARTRPLAVLVPAGGRPPRYARAWRVITLPDARSFPGYHGYLAPPPVSGGRP
ncbi:hypothetical protein GA0115240_14446 [Streptomyces sp. DvalAA-14]|uniref:hypothetical protein n=1 Tax=unclassified Streptomyces TaxID=2593676 RepID=UPI00081BABF3|nr:MULTISPECIES: hypothetical protein [unclassified Streptomyces]MYS22743.1 hypothetical protein [Streptomyces sp. SID4948]SCE21706.1 hypothetical protein GA0115240_14446 [Streptomyces sp. DvalAA-14]